MGKGTRSQEGFTSLCSKYWRRFQLWNLQITVGTSRSKETWVLKDFFRFRTAWELKGWIDNDHFKDYIDGRCFEDIFVYSHNYSLLFKNNKFLEDAFICSRFGITPWNPHEIGDLNCRKRSRVFGWISWWCLRDVSKDYSDFATQTGHLFQEFGGWLKHVETSFVIHNFKMNELLESSQIWKDFCLQHEAFREHPLCGGNFPHLSLLLR